MTKRKLILATFFTVICFAFMTVTSFAADDPVTVKNSADFMKVWKQIEKNSADDYDAVQNTTIKLDGNIEINDELSMTLDGSNALKVKAASASTANYKYASTTRTITVKVK